MPTATMATRLGRREEAAAAYESALTHDPAERRYLEQRRDRAVGRGRRGPAGAG